jgi:hypothetical protein
MFSKVNIHIMRKGKVRVVYCRIVIAEVNIS